MDQEQLKKKFKEEFDLAKWKDLKEHITRNAIILISPELNITDAAVEIAQDHVDLVSTWLQEKKIAKPDQELLDEWEKNPDKHFGFIIVQPYVLIQEILQ